MISTATLLANKTPVGIRGRSGSATSGRLATPVPEAVTVELIVTSATVARTMTLAPTPTDQSAPDSTNQRITSATANTLRAATVVPSSRSNETRLRTARRPPIAITAMIPRANTAAALNAPEPAASTVSRAAPAKAASRP